MSRIAKKPIQIPQGTDVTFRAKGPKGELSRMFHGHIDITVDGGTVKLTPTKDDKQTRALWGTYASHIKNMISGVNTPFEKKLVLEGVGFKSEVAGKELKLALGFSHPVIVKIPEDLIVNAEKNVITVSGSDKEQVGAFSAKVRALRKPEPYKGKGFRYEGEVIRRKQGKKSV
jgi:large subunit ribosomal protein L6